MRRALELAGEAAGAGEVPVGAVLVDGSGNTVAEARNRVEELHDATAHAETLAISAAARAGTDWRLTGHTLVVTLEPCAMCAMAAVWSRLGRIVYGAADPKAGAAWSLYNIPQDKRLNHHIELQHGLLADQAANLLEDFFRERR
ncbi:MAG: nucleoside deaminase [Acidimicrobiia bacterium]|nr:nucleoside deaminase [Acidimicrobiia bacterium]MBT8218173.1 nucleoside deaminase [Acidimicrobiia bacterium]NNF08840.1 nucleoside deaminase [Acidimicrobiia bacterium]NNL68894.1 nucleoside deaminase [Acidimicrobiia bacterium]